MVSEKSCTAASVPSLLVLLVLGPGVAVYFLLLLGGYVGKGTKDEFGYTDAEATFCDRFAWLADGWEGNRARAERRPRTGT